MTLTETIEAKRQEILKIQKELLKMTGAIGIDGIGCYVTNAWYPALIGV
jgi:hypothetical protein